MCDVQATQAMEFVVAAKQVKTGLLGRYRNSHCATVQEGLQSGNDTTGGLGKAGL